MKHLILAAAALFAATTAHAAGDASAGENEFKKCKSCHTIADGDDVIVKGGKTGPNLFGVVGRTAGTYDDFKYEKDMVAAGEAGLVWTEDKLVEYLPDPKGFLATFLGQGSAKSKMPGQRLKAPEDVAAYLATFTK